MEKRLSIRIDDEIERKMSLSQSTFLIKWQKIGNTEETERSEMMGSDSNPDKGVDVSSGKEVGLSPEMHSSLE
ncbi:hypothetical protein TNCV_2795851 [Trichonephila clavipes]|nr:hypothetical protein TNCV_2795851 [Trichonephila clavipes]